MDLQGSETWKNLETALRGESYAYTTYTLYGKQARKDGYVQMEEIFNETASNELAHAKLLLKQLHGGEMPHTLDNLGTAKGGEQFEADDMYPKFAAVARAEGFDEVADLFEGLGKIEATHEERYGVLIDRINNDQVFKRDEAVVWVCTVCGHLHVGKEAPLKCPVCAHPQSHFELRADNY